MPPCLFLKCNKNRKPKTAAKAAKVAAKAADAAAKDAAAVPVFGCQK